MRRIVLALAACLALPAAANDPCRTPVALVSQGAPLAVTRMAFVERKPLTIVAIGSSSTQGYGASTPDRTYPARLETLLRAAYPDQSITVLNRGVGGDTAVQMLARFERDVLAARPQLVLWQTGANDAIRGVDIETFTATLDDGLTRLRAAGADVILVSPQFAPKMSSREATEAYLERLYRVAARHGIPVFRRYEIMLAIAVDPSRLAAQLHPDGLHLSDLGYECLASQLGAAVAQGVGLENVFARQR